MTNVERLPGAGHANIEKPDHCVSLGSVQLVGRVTSRAEIRKQKDNIRFAALYRVDRSDDDARRFLQRARSRASATATGNCTRPRNAGATRRDHHWISCCGSPEAASRAPTAAGSNNSLSRSVVTGRESSDPSIKALAPGRRLPFGLRHSAHSFRSRWVHGPSPASARIRLTEDSLRP